MRNTTFLKNKAAALVVAGALAPALLMAQHEAVERGVNDLFRTAEAHNATLQSCRAAVTEADAAIQSAKTDRLPEISGQASFSYNGNGRVWDRDFSNGMGVDIPHYGNNFALKASQVVYAGGAIDAGIRLAEQSADMARLSAREQKEQVRFLLVGLYLQLHNLQNQSLVYDSNAKLAEDLIAQMKNRREQGVALRNDVTRYELQHEQMLLGQTQTDDRLRILSHQLATALGTDTTVNLLPSSAFDDEALQTLGGEDVWQERAGNQHVSLQKGQLAVEMSRTQEKLERSALLPKVSLFAEDYLVGPVTIEIPALNNNFNYWYVGVGISYNFSSLFKNNRKVRQAKLATQTATANLEAARRAVDDAVQQAYVSYLTAQSELRTQRKSVELAQQNYDVISNRYTNGLALVTDLTDAASMKLDAELALANARINLVYSYYALKYAAGQL